LIALANMFVKEIKSRKWLVKEFVMWLQSRNITKLHDTYIDEFLNEYLKSHNISKSTLKMHKSVLRKFVRFVQQTASQ